MLTMHRRDMMSSGIEGGSRNRVISCLLFGKKTFVKNAHHILNSIGKQKCSLVGIEDFQDIYEPFTGALFEKEEGFVIKVEENGAINPSIVRGFKEFIDKRLLAPENYYEDSSTGKMVHTILLAETADHGFSKSVASLLKAKLSTASVEVNINCGYTPPGDSEDFVTESNSSGSGVNAMLLSNLAKAWGIETTLDKMEAAFAHIASAKAENQVQLSLF